MSAPYRKAVAETARALAADCEWMAKDLYALASVAERDECADGSHEHALIEGRAKRMNKLATSLKHLLPLPTEAQP